MIRFKDRLKERRTALGLTQEQAAAAAGMNVTQYNGYERGRSAASAVTLPRLAHAMQTSQEWLLGQEASAPTSRLPSEPRRQTLQRLVAAFQDQVAAELGLAPADVTIRIEIL